MKHITLTLAILAGMCIQVSALEITVTPGTMREHLDKISSTTDKTCTITGEATTADLNLLKCISRNVYELDITNLIVENNEIPAYFLFDTNVSRVDLPQGVKKIGDYAFSCTPVKVLALPASLESVGNYAYADCKELKAVSVPESAVLGAGVFKGCTILDTVRFAKAPTRLSDRLFEGCSALKFNIPEDVKEIGNYTFRSTGMVKANLQNVDKVGDFAFADCLNLSEIEVDSTHPLSFGRGAFFLDKSLSSLPNWEGNLPELFAAHTLAAVPSIINNEEIHQGAFANNHNIDSITLGKDVKVIHANAFRNAGSLKAVNASLLGSAIPDVHTESFSGLEQADGRYDINLHVAKNTSDQWKEHPVWGLFNIDEASGVENVVADSAEISVNRLGTEINILSNKGIESAEVYTLSGMKLYSAQPGTAAVTISDIPAEEVVIVRVKSGSTIKVSKLM